MKVERDLGRVRAQRQPSQATHGNCLPVVVTHATGGLAGLSDYLFDITADWILARKRLIAAVICANPYASKTDLQRLESCEVWLGGEAINTSKAVYNAFLLGPVELTLHYLDVVRAFPTLFSADSLLNRVLGRLCVCRRAMVILIHL